MRAYWTTGLLLAALAAQGHAQAGANPPAPAQNASPQKAGKAASGGVRLVDPESVAARLMMATPQQRERALAALPPARQAQIRKQLEWFDSLPKAKQDAEIRWLEYFSTLPPDRQIIIRAQAQALAKLPPERRQAVNRALANLRALPPRQRAVRLNNPAFRSRFSPEELTIMEDLSEPAFLPPEAPKQQIP